MVNNVPVAESLPWAGSRTTEPRMLSVASLFSYQVEIIRFLLSRPCAMLWLDMGWGKTIALLSVIHDLIYRRRTARAALVVAPLRVIQLVWRQEAGRWAHTSGLTFSLIHGPLKRRRMAFFQKADIYLINYEGLAWFTTEMQHYFLSRGRELPFDILVWDEISKMKSANAKRSTSFVSLVPCFKFRYGMTGTQAPNGLVDLYGQYRVVDDGQRLGKEVGAFRAFFCINDGHGFNHYRVHKHLEQALLTRIRDITYTLDLTRYPDRLPPYRYNQVWVELPPKARELYDTLEREFFAELDSGVTLEVANEAGKINKCAQIANGGAYLVAGSREWERVHKEKMDALEEIVEETGHPVLVAYQFYFDSVLLRERFRNKLTVIGPGTSYEDALTIQEDWNRGRIPLLAAHPASIGHGLNFQQGSNTVAWLGLPWGLELWQQFSARLRRHGQTEDHVMVHIILAKDTVDEVKKAALEYKGNTQDRIQTALADYRRHRQ